MQKHHRNKRRRVQSRNQQLIITINTVKRQEVTNQLQMVIIHTINMDKKQEVIEQTEIQPLNIINMVRKLAHINQIQMV
jgi:hypothetical protein